MNQSFIVYLSLWIIIIRVTSFRISVSKSNLFFGLKPDELVTFFSSLDRVKSAPALVQLLTGFSVDQILNGKAYGPVSGSNIAMTTKFTHAYLESTKDMDFTKLNELVSLLKKGSELCNRANQNQSNWANRKRCARNPYGSLLSLHNLANLCYWNKPSKNRRTFPLSQQELDYLDPFSLSQLSLGSFWLYGLPINVDNFPNSVLEPILQRATSDPQLAPIVGICEISLFKRTDKIVKTALDLFPWCLLNFWDTRTTSNKQLIKAAFPSNLYNPKLVFGLLLRNWSSIFGREFLNVNGQYESRISYSLAEKFINWLIFSVGKWLYFVDASGKHRAKFKPDSQSSALNCLFYIICYRTQMIPETRFVFDSQFSKFDKDIGIHSNVKHTLMSFNIAQSLATLWSMADKIDNSPVICSRYHLTLLQIELFLSCSGSTHYFYGIEGRIQGMIKSIQAQMGPSVLDLVNFFNNYWIAKNKFGSLNDQPIFHLLNAALEHNEQFRDVIAESPFLPQFQFDMLKFERKLEFFTSYAQWNFYHMPRASGSEINSSVTKLQASYPDLSDPIPLINQSELAQKLDKMFRAGCYGIEEERRLILFTLEYILQQWCYVSTFNPDRSINSLNQSFRQLGLSEHQPTSQVATYMPIFGSMHPFIWSLLAQALERAFVIRQCIPYRFDPKLLHYMDDIQLNGLLSTAEADFIHLFKIQINNDYMRKALALLGFRSHVINYSLDFGHYMQELILSQSEQGYFIPPTHRDLFSVARGQIITFIAESKQLFYASQYFKASSMIESLYCKE